MSLYFTDSPIRLYLFLVHTRSPVLYISAFIIFSVSYQFLSTLNLPRFSHYTSPYTILPKFLKFKASVLC